MFSMTAILIGFVFRNEDVYYVLPLLLFQSDIVVIQEGHRTQSLNKLLLKIPVINLYAATVLFIIVC